MRLKGKDFFLYIGTIEPRKNIAGIVRAFDELSRHSDREYHLVLAGGYGWRLRPIREAVWRSPFRSRIHLPGYVTEEEKNYLLSRAKTFLFPSNYEGFGLPVLEAMAYGLPVITANVSSLPEVGGDVAFYVGSPDNVSQLAELMGRCAKLTGAERMDLKKRSAAWARRFSWAACASETIAQVTVW